jgi:tetratricopeptide (TPR) repeat protein
MPDNFNISPGDQLIIDAFFELKEQEEHELALRVLLPLKDKYPQNYAILFLLGATQYELKNYDQAIVHLKEALKIKPTHMLASLTLIHSLAPQNKWQVALAELRRFLSGKSEKREEHILLLKELMEGKENFSTSEKAAIEKLGEDFLH